MCVCVCVCVGLQGGEQEGMRKRERVDKEEGEDERGHEIVAGKEGMK